MVKVVPTEEGTEVSSSQGKETQPSNDVTTEQQATKDDPAGDQQPAISTAAGTSAEEEEDQRLNSAGSDAAKTGSDVESDPPTSTDPSGKPSEGEEMHHEEVPQLEPGALATADDGSDTLGSNTKDVAPTLDMDKHSGMKTFSLMRQDDESSLNRPNEGLSTHTEQEGDEENTAEALIEEEEENEEEDSGLAPRLVRQNTGVTRKFLRQNTGVDGRALAGNGKKKKAPFRAPQTMYMGHPVGSPAAEFLERQQRRLAEIRTRREEVAGLLALVTDHNPKTSGSSLPDIDAVFPDRRGREQSQGDWCV